MNCRVPAALSLRMVGALAGLLAFWLSAPVHAGRYELAGSPTRASGGGTLRYTVSDRADPNYPGYDYTPRGIPSYIEPCRNGSVSGMLFDTYRWNWIPEEGRTVEEDPPVEYIWSVSYTVGVTAQKCGEARSGAASGTVELGSPQYSDTYTASASLSDDGTVTGNQGEWEAVNTCFILQGQNPEATVTLTIRGKASGSLQLQVGPPFADPAAPAHGRLGPPVGGVSTGAARHHGPSTRTGVLPGAGATLAGPAPMTPGTPIAGATPRVSSARSSRRKPLYWRDSRLEHEVVLPREDGAAGRDIPLQVHQPGIPSSHSLRILDVAVLKGEVVASAITEQTGVPVMLQGNWMREHVAAAYKAGPARELMDSLAVSFGGTWVKLNQTWVLALSLQEARLTLLSPQERRLAHLQCTADYLGTLTAPQWKKLLGRKPLAVSELNALQKRAVLTELRLYYYDPGDSVRPPADTLGGRGVFLKLGGGGIELVCAYEHDSSKDRFCIITPFMSGGPNGGLHPVWRGRVPPEALR